MPMRQPGLHQRVVDTLGADLTMDRIIPGTVLSTEALMRRYGVSRTIIREAVKVLEQHGVVQSRRRVGVTVLPEHQWAAMSPMIVRWRLNSAKRERQLRELAELRMAVEPTAGSLAAQRATADEKQRLLTVAADLRRAADEANRALFLERDIEFHTLILEASGNAALASMASLVTEALFGGSTPEMLPLTPEALQLDEHMAVAQAVAAGDSDAARQGLEAIVGPTIRG